MLTDSNTAKVVGIVFGSIAGAILVCVGVYWIYYEDQKKKGRKLKLPWVIVREALQSLLQALRRKISTIRAVSTTQASSVPRENEHSDSPPVVPVSWTNTTQPPAEQESSNIPTIPSLFTAEPPPYTAATAYPTAETKYSDEGKCPIPPAYDATAMAYPPYPTAGIYPP